MSATKVHPIHPIGVDHDIEEIEDKGKPSDPIRNPYVDDQESSAAYLLTCFTGPLLASLLAGVWTLIPMENIITNPEYWWQFELGLLVSVLPMMYLAILGIAEYWAHMVINDFWKTFWMIFVCAQGVAMIGMVVYYSIWTFILGYYQPMPFNALIFELLAAGTAAVVIMYRLESPKKGVTPGFGKRFAWFVSCDLLQMAAKFTYAAFGIGFALIPSEYQWMLALLSPVLREVFIITFCECGYKASGDEFKRGDFLVRYAATQCAEIRHCVTMAVIIGGAATETTAYIILVLDFIINSIRCFMIIRKAKAEGVTTQVSDDIGCFVLTERVEIAVPVTFLIMMVMAYYGVNAQIMGNVKLSIWHNTAPILNIDAFLFRLSLLIAIDCTGFAINGFLINYFCGVNVLRVLKNIQKKFWLLTLVMEGFMLIEGIMLISIGGAHDLTVEFDWINGKYVNGTLPGVIE